MQAEAFGISNMGEEEKESGHVDSAVAAGQSLSIFWVAMPFMPNWYPLFTCKLGEVSLKDNLAEKRCGI